MTDILLVYQKKGLNVWKQKLVLLSSPLFSSFQRVSVCSICRKIPGDTCAPSLHTKQTATIATGKTREWIGSSFEKRSYSKTASYTCVAEELEYPIKEENSHKKVVL